jgi:hypothetical protein
MQKKYPQAPLARFPSSELSPNQGTHGVSRFDETFRLDPDGLPRRWSKADNIEETFKEARQQVTSSPPIGKWCTACLSVGLIVFIRDTHRNDDTGLRRVGCLLDRTTARVGSSSVLL